MGFRETEDKWMKLWNDPKGLNSYRTSPDPKRKYYVLEMFAYPSGDIHMGHFRNYTIGDIPARYRMMQGYDVLHPFGWDAFGQPAEGAAIKKGNILPRDWTLGNIATGRATLQRMALTYDWDREIITCNPDYYRWTQWIFLQLYKNGLAYLGASWVNWCTTCDTSLTNEQAEGGSCWRCGKSVTKRKLDRCWYFRYTKYAERLHKDIDRLTEWPEQVRTQQRNWIGRSEGAIVEFPVVGGGELKLKVFTTRPDTIYGVTFLALSPEFQMLDALTAPPQKDKVEEYVRKALVRDEAQRDKEKDGVSLMNQAINPFTGEKVQLWVADYVLGGYGTGVVMGVPAHDQRDFEFARKYKIPLRVVIQPKGGTLDPAAMTEAYADDGIMVNSGPFDGTPNPEGIAKVTAHAKAKGWGGPTINYKLKDWLVSRQRYWGCPIPIIHCEKCGPQPVPEEQLPVVLPTDIKNFIPKGRSPLADSPEYMKAACPKCGAAAQRDPDTMDTFMCSSWYQNRYVDPKNDREPWSMEEAKKWLPVDLYIGGVEHARGHCLYFRFITKVLFDLGKLPVDEPCVRLFNHGMVCDEKGEIMSKSKGNVVSPGAIMDQWGVDACRIAMCFFAPSEDQISWSESGLVGAARFLRRVEDFAEKVKGFPAGEPDRAKLSAPVTAVWRKIHQVIQKATFAYEKDLHFNTALAQAMELLNLLDAAPANDDDRKALRMTAVHLAKVLAPMAPFLGEELHERLGGSGSVFRGGFPVADAEAAKESEFEIVLQVNGKVRGKVVVDAGATEEQVKAAALAELGKQLEGKAPKKVIVVKGRLVNVVV